MKKIFLGFINLGFHPVSNFEFEQIKSTPEVRQHLKESSLYIIAQRSEMYFEDIEFDEESATLEFNIRQVDSNIISSCKFPMFENDIPEFDGQELKINYGTNDMHQELLKQRIHAIEIYKNELSEANTIIVLTPERFLYNLWTKSIVGNASENYKEFLSYKVHYVGIATKQHVANRLTGHNALQSILSNEYPNTYGSLPTNEIVLLLYRTGEHFHIKTYEFNDDFKDAGASFAGVGYPEDDTITKDVEKAIVNCLKPKYNKELFKNYPVSKDGLHKHNYDGMLYSFNDPIKLVYDHGEIIGNLEFGKSDTILMVKNKKPELFKE